MFSSRRALLRHPSYIFAAILIFLIIVYISPSATLSYFGGMLVATPFLMGVLAEEDVRAIKLIRNFFNTVFVILHRFVSAICFGYYNKYNEFNSDRQYICIRPDLSLHIFSDI